MQTIQSSLFHKIGPLPTSRTGPHPALILVHGRGSNEDDLLGLVPYLDPRFFVLSVRAPLDFPNGGFTWYSMEEVGTPHPGEFMESYARLERFVRDAKSSYPIDPEKTFLLGFSMGSVMSLGFALSRPLEVRGVVAHSGYVPENLPLTFSWEGLDACRFFVAHGLEDPVIPIRYGRRTNQILAEKGADLTYKEYPIGHQVSEESINDLATWLTTVLDDQSPS
jgi:phospholipase/carboxylesterase